MNKKAENGRKCPLHKYHKDYELFCKGWYKCSKCGGFLKLDCDEQHITYKMSRSPSY